jgi:hypothetical protein
MLEPVISRGSNGPVQFFSAFRLGRIGSSHTMTFSVGVVIDLGLGSNRRTENENATDDRAVEKV